MGSLMSPIMANLYMEEMEERALNSFTGTTPSHWLRYVDDTWVKIKTQESEPFTRHINMVDKNIKFTREDRRDNSLPFLYCAVSCAMDGNLSIELYRKPTHRPVPVVRLLPPPGAQTRGNPDTRRLAKNVSSNTKGKQKERTHIKKALQTCGYPKWTSVKSSKRRHREPPKTERDKRRKVVIPYVAGLSEKFRRIFQKHKIQVNF